MNLIGLRNDTEVQAEVTGEWIVSKYNLTTSQAWVHHDGSIGFLPAFMDSIKSRTVTILREDWGKTGTVKSVQKFLSKYPTFRVVNQDGTEFDEGKFMEKMQQWEDI